MCGCRQASCHRWPTSSRALLEAPLQGCACTSYSRHHNATVGAVRERPAPIRVSPQGGKRSSQGRDISRPPTDVLTPAAAGRYSSVSIKGQRHTVVLEGAGSRVRSLLDLLDSPASRTGFVERPCSPWFCPGPIDIHNALCLDVYHRPEGSALCRRLGRSKYEQKEERLSKQSRRKGLSPVSFPAHGQRSLCPRE